MNSEYAAALFGLLGVAIGGGIGFATTVLQTNTTVNLSRRDEILKLCGEYGSYIERARTAYQVVTRLEARIEEVESHGEEPSHRLNDEYVAALDVQLRSYDEWKIAQYQVGILASPELGMVIAEWKEDLPNRDFLVLKAAFLRIAKRDVAVTKKDRKTAESEFNETMAHKDVKRLLHLDLNDAADEDMELRSGARGDAPEVGC